jgi:RNA polymerase sigma factor (sigma-70 family)
MTIDILAYQNDIRAKAKIARIPGMDWEDVFQEVVLHLLLVQTKFDPTRANLRTFVSRVTTNKIRDLLRRSYAKKRGLLETISLDALIEEEYDNE